MMRTSQRRKVPAAERIKQWKIVKGDEVMVRWGKEKGKVGKVVKVVRPQNKVIVQGLNLRKRHIKKGPHADLAKEQNKGEKQTHYTAESPIFVNKLALMDPVEQKPTKVKWAFTEKKGRFVRVRVSKLTGNVIPKPTRQMNQPWKQLQGPKDTRPDIVLLKTFNEDTINPLKLVAYNHKDATNSAASEAADSTAEAAKK